MKIIFSILLIMIPLFIGNSQLTLPNPPEDDTFQQELDEYLQTVIEQTIEVQEYLKKHESISLLPYPDGNGMSIGWGHQITTKDKLTYPITRQEADSLFVRDFSIFYKESLRQFPNKSHKKQVLIAALLYNVGHIGSNLKYEIKQNLPITSILSYNKYKGDPHPALTKRRKWEYNYYNEI